MAFFSANFMLQTPHQDDHHHQPLPSLNSILPSCSPQDHYHGGAAFVGNKRSMSFSGIEVGGGEEELSDEGSLQLGGGGEKKRRLNMEQVKTLEKSFEIGNKLEPERKMQLARALGLQPRQIAIWFQNRRARWKTKQLEKDYDILKRQFDAVKSDNDALLAQNHKLQAQIMALKSREGTESINLNKETEQGSCSNRSENSSENNNNNNIKLDIISTTTATATATATAAAAAAAAAAATTINSPVSPHSITLFPIPSRPNNNTGSVLFQTPPPSKMDHHHHHHHMPKEESFTNMFCSMDDQSGFWPWLEHQHFN